MKKRRGNKFKDYFTLVELSRAFGYKNPRGYYSSKGRDTLDAGISFVVERVCEVKDKEISDLKGRIREIAGGE